MDTQKHNTRPDKKRMHTGWFRMDSIEVSFGLSLSRLATIYNISRNMMSLVHRNERMLPDHASAIWYEFVRAQNITTQDVINHQSKKIASLFVEERKKALNKQLQDLIFSQEAYQSKLEPIREEYNLLVKQLACSESINFENIHNDKSRTKMTLILEISILEKKKALRSVSPQVQFELQLKIDSMQFQIDKIKAELELLMP